MKPYLGREMRRFDFSDPGFAGQFRAFLNERRGSAQDVDGAVGPVLEAVREEGLEAVLRYTARFDGVELTATQFAMILDGIDLSRVRRFKRFTPARPA